MTEQKITTVSSREIFELAAKHMKGPFKPIAYHDDRMDTIEVLFRDCSVREEYVSDYLTILTDRHPEAAQSNSAGFFITNAEDLLRDKGFFKDERVTVLEIFDTCVQPTITKNQEKLKDGDFDHIASWRFILRETEMRVDWDIRRDLNNHNN